MPLYTYTCKNCDNNFDIIQSFNDKALILCECGGELRKVLYPPNFSVKEIKTVAQLSEHNTKKLGVYGLQERRAKDAENKKRARQAAREVLQEKLDASGNPGKVCMDFPDPSNKVDLSLAKLSPPQQKEYILTGKKPITAKLPGSVTGKPSL